MGLVSLVIDSREPASIPALFDSVAPYTVAPLDAGDLLAVCADNVLLLVERKEPSDLCASIQDGRVFHQASRMRAVSPWSYLVVTGQLHGDARTGNTFFNGQVHAWPWASIQGALLTVQDLGVHVLQLHSESDYPRAIIRLADRKRETLRLAPQRTGSAVSEGESILLALPGIGDVHARAVLDYCGTVAWSLDYLTTNDEGAPIRQIPGIGPITRHRIRRALGLQEGERLSVYVEATDTLVPHETEIAV